MGRRSDHSRSELEARFIDEGERHLAKTGLARFSAREVAKRVGYSIGTLYNVFGSADELLTAINGRTLARWAAELRASLAASDTDRIAALVRGYFTFAFAQPNLWIAIYEHRIAAPEPYRVLVGDIMGIVETELAAVLPGAAPDTILALARSLLAIVHGHCFFALYLTFDMLGETAPLDAAVARLREAIAAAGQTPE